MGKKKEQPTVIHMRRSRKRRFETDEDALMYFQDLMVQATAARKNRNFARIESIRQEMQRFDKEMWPHIVKRFNNV